MGTRSRPADLGGDDARRLTDLAAREIEGARVVQGVSHRVAAGRAGVSPSRWGRLVRRELREPTLDLICRAARSVGLNPSLLFYPSGERVRDRAQLPLLGRFERLLGSPLRMLREVGLPGAGDLRAWDGRISDGSATASIEGEAKILDVQAMQRRIALKQRDDPSCGVVILVVNRTAHNRRVLAEHREALRSQFPLDGAAIARSLRSGRVPPLSGIIVA
jgi:hypothetical protein